MKKIYACFIVCALIGLTSVQFLSSEVPCDFDKEACGVDNLIQRAKEGGTDFNALIPVQILPAKQFHNSSLAITFNHPITTSEIIKIAEINGIKLTNVHYKQGDIQGGYSIFQNESVSKAMQRILAAHKAFLASAIAKTEKDIASATDSATKKRISGLLAQFLPAQSKTNAYGLKFDTIETNNEGDIDSIKNMGLIKNITPIQRKSKSYLKTSVNENSDIKSYYHESWAPCSGTSEVTQAHTYQTFYFDKTSDYDGDDTYEHETQVYNNDFSDYAGSWSSNMPSAYYDTPFSDKIDNFTIGTFDAALLKINTQYYTFMSLSAGSASNAVVRIKGQKGHRFPSSCYSTWCVFPDATTSSMIAFTAPNAVGWMY